MLVKSEKKIKESREIRSNENFSTVWYQRNGEIAVNDIIMVFTDMVCFKELLLYFIIIVIITFIILTVILPKLFANKPLYSS